MSWPPVRLLLVAMALAVVAGCERPAAPPPAPPARPTLLIGLIPERNIFKQLERYEPLAEYLSAQTGVEIKLKVLTHYGNVIENFESLQLDGAFFGSLGYTLAHARLGVEVLARPESDDGSSSYTGVIFVRRSSGISKVEQMKGARLALVAPATFAGCLFPMAHLHDAGVRDVRAHFEEIYFAGSQEAAIQDVLEKRADVGAAKNTMFKLLATTSRRIERELTVLAESVEVPENALALKKSIDPALKEKLLDAMLGMHRQPQGVEVLRAFGARRFVRTTDAEYRPVLAHITSAPESEATCYRGKTR